MVWQDYVFAVGGIFLAAVLIPTVRNKTAQIPLTTSASTAAALWVYSYTFYTLELFLSAAATLVSAALWTFIAVKRRP